MGTSANVLRQVITYNKAYMALLQNSYCGMATANKKFREMKAGNPAGQLGDTLTFDIPPKMTTVRSLVAAWQGVQQRYQSLTVDNPISASYAFTSQQFILNVEEYMDMFGRSAVAEVGAVIESDILQVAERNTYRFYGNGVDQISTQLQLAQALTRLRTFGDAGKTKGYLSMETEPGIINSMGNQFVPNRNERALMSWEIGEFAQCDWYRSNLLTRHVAGTEGNAGSVLTVVSVVANSEGGVTQITFSGTDAASDADSIKAYDKFQFVDGVAGKPNLRFLTNFGKHPTANPVQFRATADAGSTAGSQVTVDIYPPLQAAAGTNRNINSAITAGMQVTVLPDHVCGMITTGDPFYVGMPQLPDQSPFATSSEVDKDSGISMRMTYGAQLGQNQIGFIHDAIWGKTMVDDYAIMIALPA